MESSTEVSATKAQPAPADGRVRTISGNLQNSLGFWFTLALLQGAAWLIWLCYQIVNYFYFYTKPLDTFGRGLPW